MRSCAPENGDRREADRDAEQPERREQPNPWGGVVAGDRQRAQREPERQAEGDSREALSHEGHGDAMLPYDQMPVSRVGRRVGVLLLAAALAVSLTYPIAFKLDRVGRLNTGD